MPLGKYYCDYCDKEFQDTLYARKRHLQGLQHQRARSLWYNSFKADTNQPLPLDGVCNRFVRTGFCPYGDSCKYLHPNPTQPPPPPPVSSSVQPWPWPHQVNAGGASFQGAAVGGIPWDNLPPSLKPPPEGGYPPLPFVDWG